MPQRKQEVSESADELQVGLSPVVELHDLAVRGHLLAGEQQQLQRTDQSHPFSRDRSGSDLQQQTQRSETSPADRNVGCDAVRAVNSSQYLFTEETYRKTPAVVNLHKSNNIHVKR